MSQSGDRELVLARLRRGAAVEPPPNPAHPPPAPDAHAPPPRSRLLDDGAPLVDVFAATATAAGCTLHRGVDAESIDDIVARHDVRRAVTTAEAAVERVVELLRASGVEVVDAADREAAAAADLGVSGCRAGVASTGSVVIGSNVPGARWASLLPAVHLCVVDAGSIVGEPGDVLRPLAGAPRPAHLAFVTGPSRTADIEQLLTRGVHGPVAVEVVLVNVG